MPSMRHGFLPGGKECLKHDSAVNSMCSGVKLRLLSLEMLYFHSPVIQIGLQSTGRLHWLGKKGVGVCLSFWFFFFLFRKRKEKPVQKRVGTAVLIPAIVQPPREAYTQASEPFGIFSNMQRLSTGIKARDTHTVSQGTQSLAKSLATPNIEDVSGALGCFARWKHCSVSFLD